MTVKDIYDNFNHLDKHLDFDLEVLSPGKIIYRVTIQDKHLSSPNVGHGAVTAGLMDSTLGTTALTAVFDEGNLVSTVEFKLNYFKPTFLGDKLEARGVVDFKGKSLVTTSAQIIKVDSGELVAKGMGTFNIYPQEKRLKDLIS